MRLTHPAVVLVALGAVLLGTFAWREMGSTAGDAPPRSVNVETAAGRVVALEVPVDSAGDIQEGLELLKVEEKKWADAVALAEATPRMQLAAVIGNMQALARENADLGPQLPACLATAHAYFVDSQKATIEVFLAFMDSEFKARMQLERNDPARAMRNYEMTRASCASP